MDVIQEMDIPGFHPDSFGVAPAWHDVAALSELPVEGVRRLDSAGRGMFIRRDGSGIRVYDSRCPHQATNIPELALDGTTLTCPRHQWSFDIATGECIAKGDSPLRGLEHRIVDGRLQVFW